MAQLLYIGQAKNLKARLQQHAPNDCTLKYNYVYSFALLLGKDINQVEAALVFHFAPIGNSRFLKDKYTYSSVEITIKGQTLDLKSDISFMVYEGNERF